MSTIQDKQDLTVTVTTPEQDAPVSSAAPHTIVAGEDLPDAVADKTIPAATSGTGPETAPQMEQDGSAPVVPAEEASAAIPEIYPLSLHDALPICHPRTSGGQPAGPGPCQGSGRSR